MIRPKYLSPGSKIAILSPSGYVKEDYIRSTVNYLRKHQYEAVVYESCLNRNFQFAGNEQERIADFQKAIDDKSIDAILCSRGGYGAIQIIDKIDFTKLIENPKWILGFSDITNFHLILNKLGINSIHCQMTKGIHDDNKSKAITDIFRILEGHTNEIIADTHKLNKPGETKAEIIGGNLSIIYSLQGTKFEIDCDNKILFIEDINEYLYHLDRMMNNLELSGKLNNLKGLIVGRFTDMQDNSTPFGMDKYEIINKYISQYKYPVCYNFPVGHIKNNLPIIEGEKYILKINSDNVILKQE